MIKKALGYYLLSIFSLLFVLNSSAARYAVKAEVKAAITLQSEEKKEVISPDLISYEGITLQSSEKQVRTTSRTLDQKRAFPVHRYAQLFQLQQYGIPSLHCTCIEGTASSPPLYLANRVIRI